MDVKPRPPARGASASGSVACPILGTPDEPVFRDLVRRSGAFSMAFSRHLDALPPEDQVAWTRQSLASGSRLLQPWALEVLYAVAAQKVARFSRLEALLGLSSRTLAARLKDLEEDGLLERRVVAARPVRTEYVLTKHGRATAALASLLFTHLALSAAVRPDAPLRDPAKSAPAGRNLPARPRRGDT
jgi:DNA-binding HxlR family transcriptional regulator